MSSSAPRRQRRTLNQPRDSFSVERVQSGPTSGVTQLAQTSGNHSPVVAAGAHSRNVHQWGTNPTVHIGDYLDQLPPTMREREKGARGTTWGLGLIATLGAASSVATITGLNIGRLQLDGLLPIFRAIGEDGIFSALARHDTFILIRLLFCLLLIGLPVSFYLRLRQRGWVSSGRGRIYERRNGRLTSARIVGKCPIPHCGAPTRVKRVVVDHKTYTTNDAQGRQVQKERAIRDFRLVCRANGDHRFRFDVTNCSDSPSSGVTNQ